MTPDPITQVYRAIRERLLADPDVARLLKRANAPDLTSTKGTDPLKSSVMDADLPELLVIPTGATYHVGRTNHAHAIRRNFQVRLVGRGPLLHESVFPLEWSIFCAMVRMLRDDPKLGLSFVERVEVRESTSTYSVADDAARGTGCWVTVASLVVDMCFSDEDIGGTCGRALRG